MRTDGPILFFDSTCPFCCGWVRFVFEADDACMFRFAPLSGSTARQVLAGMPEDLPEAIVVAMPENGRMVWHARSDAMIEIMKALDGIWRCGLLLSLVPRWLRDSIYDLVARYRHRLPAPGDGNQICRIPPGLMLP